MDTEATEHEINQGLSFLAIENGITKNDLKYIGFSDCSFINEGAKLMQFNITKKTHLKYKSTIAYKHGFKE